MQGRLEGFKPFGTQELYGSCSGVPVAFMAHKSEVHVSNSVGIDGYSLSKGRSNKRWKVSQQRANRPKESCTHPAARF